MKVKTHAAAQVLDFFFKKLEEEENSRYRSFCHKIRSRTQLNRELPRCHLKRRINLAKNH